MLDLGQFLNQGISNLRTWRTRYTSQEYPHKVVINLMYRAYAVAFLWHDYEQGLFPRFTNEMEAFMFVAQKYQEVCRTKVNANLLDWLNRYPDKPIGNVTYSGYENLATRAETDSSAKEEVEFSFLFNYMTNMCVEYWIALRLCGKNQVDAIAQVTGVIIEELQPFNYGIAKQVFTQLYVNRYMAQNYNPLP
jgi:hypothetical protein